MIKFIKHDLFTQTDQFIYWIEEMAINGYFISNISESSIFVKFNKGTPQKLKYSIYFNDNYKSPNDDFFMDASNNGWETISKSEWGRCIYLFKSQSSDIDRFKSIFLNDVNNKINTLKMLIKRNLYPLIIILINLSNVFSDYILLNNLLSIFQILFILKTIIFSLKYFIIKKNMSKIKSNFIFISGVILNILFFIVLCLISLALIYRISESKIIERQKVHFDYVLPQEIDSDNSKLINNIYKESLFSFNPRSTYLFEYVGNDGYTKMIYQTRAPITSSVSNSFDSYMKAVNPEIQNNVLDIFEILLQKENWILYNKKIDQTEYLSIFMKNEVFYTLHTVNVDYETHLLIVNCMGGE